MAEDSDLDAFTSAQGQPPAKFTQPGEFVMIDSLLVDVTLTENHVWENEVTQYPVESGSTMSDQIRPKQCKVTLEGLVSNTPLTEMRAKRKEFSAAAAQYAYGALLAIWNRREPVTIRSSLGTFKNMALENLSFPRSSTDGEALKFSAAFVQIVTVINARTRVRTSLPGGGGNKPKALGTKPSLLQSQKTVLWKKGINPDYTRIESLGADYVRQVGTSKYLGGGPWKGEVEYVLWIQRSITDPTIAGTLVAVTNNPDVSLNTPAIWTHMLTGEELTAEELARFNKDIDRDQNNRKYNTEQRIPLRSGGSNDTHSVTQTILRRPVDLNATNKTNPATVPAGTTLSSFGGGSRPPSFGGL